MTKKIIILLSILAPLTVTAQLSRAWFIEKNIFNHLDVGVNIGTTGLGLTVSTPVTDYARVRAGVDYMPHINIPMTFDLGMYQEVPEDVVDKEEWQDRRFSQMQDVMKKLTGIEVGRKVQMNTHGRLFDFKFLVDIYPWKQNRGWHFTAGFYYGSSRVAHTENNAQVMPLLVALKTYNNFYEYVMKTNFIDEPIYNDFYLDPDVADALKDKVREYGRIGVCVGRLNGKNFMMEPGKDAMVSGNMYVHNFKPYLGMGYSGNLTKDGRWKFGFDAGVLFWGKPRLISHEQPLIDPVTQLQVTEIDAEGNEQGLTVSYDLINDIDSMYGKVGSYVKFASALKVYPVVNFKVSFNIL